MARRILQNAKSLNPDMVYTGLIIGGVAVGSIIGGYIAGKENSSITQGAIFGGFIGGIGGAASPVLGPIVALGYIGSLASRK